MINTPKTISFFTTLVLSTSFVGIAHAYEPKPAPATLSQISGTFSFEDPNTPCNKIVVSLMHKLTNVKKSTYPKAIATTQGEGATLDKGCTYKISYPVLKETNLLNGGNDNYLIAEYNPPGQVGRFVFLSPTFSGGAPATYDFKLIYINN